MAEITISSALIRSMLANRHKKADEVAGELSLSTDFATIASTDTVVSFEDINKLATYFKKPWSYMLKKCEEVVPNFGHDNRTYDNRKVAISSEMLTELKLAEYRLANAMELFPDDKVKFLNFNLSTTTKPDDIAEKVRAFLGITTEDQLKSKDKHAALRLWAEAIQAKGVYVSQRKIVDDTVRAFSIARDGYAIIVVDTEYPYARIFSLLHEYCHILLKSTGICDLVLVHNEREHYCNEFAAAVMLPKSLMKSELSKFTLSDNADANDEYIKKLSEHFRVSQAALLIRLHTEGYINDDKYDTLERRRKRRRANTSTNAGGGGSYYATAISGVGKRYAQNVFSAVSDGAINRTDASALLGVGEHIVDRFRRELFSHSGDAL